LSTVRNEENGLNNVYLTRVKGWKTCGCGLLTPALSSLVYVSASNCRYVTWCCRLFANKERGEDTEDEIDEIFAKYKESLKGQTANDNCLHFVRQ